MLTLNIYTFPVFWVGLWTFVFLCVQNILLFFRCCTLSKEKNVSWAPKTSSCGSGRSQSAMRSTAFVGPTAAEVHGSSFSTFGSHFCLFTFLPTILQQSQFPFSILLPALLPHMVSHFLCFGSHTAPFYLLASTAHIPFVWLVFNSNSCQRKLIIPLSDSYLCRAQLGTWALP